MASASGNLKLIHQRVEKILTSDGVLTDAEMRELDGLGRLALHMDDVKYRKVHTTGAMNPASERKSKKKK